MRVTKDERKRFAAVIETAECLFVENLALKLVLEHRGVQNWQKLVNRLMEDEDVMGGVRLKFKDLFDNLQRVPDPAVALDTLLGPIPRRKKPN